MSESSISNRIKGSLISSSDEGVFGMSDGRVTIPLVLAGATEAISASVLMKAGVWEGPLIPQI